MPNHRPLSDQELIDVSHHWRRLALTGTPGAVAEARRYETELRRRFGTLDLAASAGDRPDRQPATPSGSAPWPATPSSTDRTDGDTGDVAARVATRSAEALHELLHNLRVLLAMDIVFVTEFVDGHKIYRHIDHDEEDPVPVKTGDSAPLETTLCQRVVDGRLPELHPDARAEMELAGLAAATTMNIGAYLSTPVVRRDGTVYGTLCCISHTARSALGNRQIDALRHVAGIVAAELDKHRG